MGILLTILKIFGIILLSVLALVLLLIILILFVPIRYKADAVLKESDPTDGTSNMLENLHAKASFSWLLHLVRGGISYPESKEFKIKVLCFTVFSPKKNKDEDLSDESDEDYEEDTFEPQETKYAETLEKEEGFEARADNNYSADTENEAGKEDSKSISDDNSDTDNKDISDESNDCVSKDVSDSHNQPDSSDASDEDNEYDEFDDGDDNGRSFFEFIGDVFNTIYKIIKIPQDVFKKIQYTTSRIYAKINMVKNTLSNDIFKRAFEVTKKQIIKVIKMIIPKKFHADFIVGMDDPTVTADILAAYGVMYPVIVNKVFIAPDFERRILAGEVHLKGRITVFTILWACVILYFNKDVRKTYRRFRKIIDS